MHITRRTHAENSMTHFLLWESVVSIEKVDLVMIEFNVNDSFISELPHALEDKGNTGKLKRKSCTHDMNVKYHYINALS